MPGASHLTFLYPNVLSKMKVIIGSISEGYGRLSEVLYREYTEYCPTHRKNYNC